MSVNRLLELNKWYKVRQIHKHQFIDEVIGNYYWILCVNHISHISCVSDYSITSKAYHGEYYFVQDEAKGLSGRVVHLPHGLFHDELYSFEEVAEEELAIIAIALL